jgi:alanine-synthesizing transaminase
VQLSSFFTPLLGFRLTLLETDEDRFESTVKKLAEKIVEYIDSTKRTA